MKIEVLVTAMHIANETGIIELVEKMNITTDAVVINQNDNWEESKTIAHKGKNIKYLSVIDRGVSKSRNLAIANSSADIILIGDDDLTYTDDFAEKITAAYNRHPEADGISFFVESTDPIRKKKQDLEEKQIFKKGTLYLSAVQLTFKRKSLNNISFNEKFGPGSTYIMGEENVFLFDFMNAKKIMYKCPEKIADVSFAESTWFTGFNKDYFFYKGACYQEMFGWQSVVMNAVFVLLKTKLYKENLTMLEAFLQMQKGSTTYRKDK